jgi:hypothetical protein
LEFDLVKRALRMRWRSTAAAAAADLLLVVTTG